MNHDPLCPAHAITDVCACYLIAKTRNDERAAMIARLLNVDEIPLKYKGLTHAFWLRTDVLDAVWGKP